MKKEIHKWSVAWICSFINFLYLGVPRLSGMFYLAAIGRYNVSRNQAALPFVLCYTVRNVAGPFIGCLSKKVKVETLILCGCFLSSVGVGVCFFAEDINTVSILWGGIFGLGFGLSTILIPSVLNQHFNKYITNANGIAFGGECIAGFVLPPLYEFCLNTFGPSGSFLILSGLLLHGIPAAMLLSPPDKKLDSEGRDLNSIKVKWDSWVSIDKAGCSGDNAFKKDKEAHGGGLLHDEVKSLLDESKNCYGTPHVAIAIENKGELRPLNESGSPLDRLKPGCKHVPSDQYVILSDETSPNSKFTSCSKYMDDTRYPTFNQENCSILGESTGIKQDVIAIKEASMYSDSFESKITRGALTSYVVCERTRNQNSQLSLLTKSLSVSSDSFSFYKQNQHDAITVVEPKETDVCKHYNRASQNFDNTSHNQTRKSSDDEKIEKYKKSNQVEFYDETPRNSKLVSHEISSCEKNNKDSEVPETTEQYGHCDEASQNVVASSLKSPCVSFSLNSNILVGVSPDLDEPSTHPSHPQDISNESNRSERPCCPPACSVFADPAFLLILFTQSSSIFVATTFTTILVEFSIDAGVDSALAVYVLMCFSAADMVGRFGLGWITDGAWLSGVAFSALCFGVKGAVLLSAPVAYQGFGLVMGAVAVYGAVLGGVIVIGPVVVTEHIEKEAVNVALASRLALFAPMSLVQSSMIGYFRDTLGSYNGILYLLGTLCMVCAVLCFLIPPASRCRKKVFQENTVTS